MITRRAVIWIVCLTVAANSTEPTLSGQQPVQSASGQFSVLPGEPSGAVGSPAFLSEANLLHLDPTLLTVSAERLRQHLNRELQDTSPWEGRIVFSLRTTDSFDAPVRVTAEWAINRWRYHVSLPDYIEHDRFIRALVEVNLLEIANRNATGRAAEIPAWLTEGLTAHLLVSRAIELILPTPKLKLHGVNITPWVVEEFNYDPLAQAREQLRTNAPLSIEQLSWPTPASFEGRQGEAYRHCAHLLVTRLLQLPDGAARMNSFIRNLHRHYNWQVTFLEIYGGQFPGLLEFEKWWALEVAHFTGRQLGHAYDYSESVHRLKRAVRVPVEVRLATNSLPMHGEIRLQTVIEEWEANRQQRALEQVLGELAGLRVRIAPELITLLDHYRLTLQHYLKNRDRTGIYLPKGANRQASLTILVRRTVKTLDQLDAQLSRLLPEPAASEALAGSQG